MFGQGKIEDVQRNIWSGDCGLAVKKTEDIEKAVVCSSGTSCPVASKDIRGG